MEERLYQPNGRLFKFPPSPFSYLTSLQSSSSFMAESPAASSVTAGRKVRVIAKIREAVDKTPSKLISVSKSRHTSTISFLDQSKTNPKQTDEFDHCYEPGDDNSTIFFAEIKPLVSWVFDGHCASIVAFGATASGKSYTIQGSDTNPGLAVLAMEEFLLMADKTAMSVAVSYYEVYQDQIYDLLSKNERAVSLLENAQGKIQLKGLSQIFVKSIIDFEKLYVYDSRRKTQKTASQPSRRSHKGLMIHLFSSGEYLNDHHLIGRMNFVDLAGFGDPRRKSVNTCALAENSRINKSLYAVQSVVYALNCNDSRVPYRDSKLTYMLRDSLSGTNKILMITCLNQAVCQDTIYMINLASRCSKGSRRVFKDSLKNVESTQNSLVNFSSKDVKKSVISSSSRNAKGSGLRKKLITSRLPLSDKRTNNADGTALVGGSKKIDEVEQGNIGEKVSDPMDIVSDALLTPQESKKHIDVVDSPTLQASLDEDCGIHTAKEISPGHEGASPPLSARLQELSNYLKSLQTSTLLNKGMLQDVDLTIIEPTTPAATSYIDDAGLPKVDTTNSINLVEPETPAANKNISINHKWDDAILSSPWTTLNVRSAGVKKCLTQECVRFINSASKEELKELKGIGDKRATYIMRLREKSPEHFKNIDDLKDVGLSAKQIKTMMKNIAGDMFS